MTTDELAQLDERMAWLISAAELLPEIIMHTEPPWGYVLEALRRDLECINEPVRRLILECRRERGGRGDRRLRSSSRKSRAAVAVAG